MSDKQSEQQSSGGLGHYFGSTFSALKAIGEGMAVTMSWMFRKPATIQYPDRYDGRLNTVMQDLEPELTSQHLPSTYRGILEVDMDICTACKACERACPIDCISIEVEKVPDDRKRIVTRFDIDIAKCMFCGLCVDPCPTHAIVHTAEFAAASQYVENLTARFVPDPRQPFVPFKAGKGVEYTRKPVGSVLQAMNFSGAGKDTYAPLPPFAGGEHSFTHHADYRSKGKAKSQEENH